MIARNTLNALLVGMTLVAAFHTASAQEILVETATVTPYLNGGIGKDEIDAMRQVAKDYPLRMTIAQGANNEFTMADVSILDTSGNPVFELPNAGPLLYVALPEGRYTVIARNQGVTKTQRVTLKATSGSDVVFDWRAGATNN